MALTETLWWNGDPDADGEATFGDRDHLAWAARHRAPLLSVTRLRKPGEPRAHRTLWRGYFTAQACADNVSDID